MKPKVLVLTSAGTNCDKETAFAFELAGAGAEMIHINRIKENSRLLNKFQIMALPGGFTYGDDVGAGKIFANELKFILEQALRKFLRKEKLIIGICNGFQILVKAGMLPGNGHFEQTATLALNDSAKFEDRWVYLKSAASACIWTKGIEDAVYFPVAHGEGKFIPRDNAVLENMKINRQIVFQYVDKAGKFSPYPDNPNGSLEHIAGICDVTGRVFGLMPHPERHIFRTQHPQWARFLPAAEQGGLRIFENAVKFIQEQ